MLLPTDQVNRFVDAYFLADMALSFFTPFRASWHARDAGNWVTDRRRIARNYLKGWFAIDLVSILPFDIVSVAIESEEMKKLTIVRVVRLMRLAKLARIMRAGRMLKRWEASITVRYSTIALCNFLFMAVFSAHWIACTWRLVLEFEDGETDAHGRPRVTWLTVYAESTASGAGGGGGGGVGGVVGDPQMTKERPGHLWVGCFYWAVTTISTIGYGDAANPQNSLERAIALLCMVVGSVVWAYILGGACSLIGSRNMDNVRFRCRMDDLTEFCHVQVGRSSSTPLLATTDECFLAFSTYLRLTRSTYSFPLLSFPVSMHVAAPAQGGARRAARVFLPAPAHEPHRAAEGPAARHVAHDAGARRRAPAPRVAARRALDQRRQRRLHRVHRARIRARVLRAAGGDRGRPVPRGEPRRGGARLQGAHLRHGVGHRRHPNERPAARPLTGARADIRGGEWRDATSRSIHPRLCSD